MNEFDFTQAPLPPLILSTHIPTGLTAVCSANYSVQCTSNTAALPGTRSRIGHVPGPFTYHVQRDGADLPQCVIAGTSSTDVPGSGDHFYRIYSVDAQGTASPLSAAAEANEP